MDQNNNDRDLLLGPDGHWTEYESMKHYDSDLNEIVLVYHLTTGKCEWISPEDVNRATMHVLQGVAPPIEPLTTNKSLTGELFKHAFGYGALIGIIVVLCMKLFYHW